MTQSIPRPLLNGYWNFRSDRYVSEAERFKSLAEGQSPKVMVIGCADSRVDPATIFSAAPGELFVVRNVAALVPPYEESGVFHGTSAALEYAVTHLKVENVVVLGHGMCGGIHASLFASGDKSDGQFIGPWIAQLSETRDRLLPQIARSDAHMQQKALEHAAVKYSLSTLRSYPFVTQAIVSGDLSLHGAWFSIAEGILYWRDPEKDAFMPVPAPGDI